jgi:type VI secretion system protein ImpH
VSYRDDLKAAPGRFDLFRVLRELERSAPHRPRISDSNVMAEDVVSLAQDPFLAFPDSNLSAVDETSDNRLRLHTRFLGFFGPQGALPLTTTVEAYWWYPKDPSFPRFADLFANRFQQLFFRAWADARPIAQFDRPRDDRFFAYVGAFAGIGSSAFRDRDSVPDIAKLPYAGLVSSRVKSSRRLAQLIRGVFKLDATVIERVGSWLTFEPSDIMAIGQNGSSLGTDTFVGGMAYSINDKFRVAIKTTSLEQYTSLLPNAPLADRLADLIFFYIGHRYEYDVELSLPAHLAPPAKLGESGQLGWTGWIAPPKGPEAEGEYLNDARFNLSERRKAARAVRQKKQGTKAGTK